MRAPKMLLTIERAIDASPPGRLFEWLKARFYADPQQDYPRTDRLDLGIAIAFGLIGAIVTFLTMHAMPAGIYGPYGFDIWFQADEPRVMAALTSRVSMWHYRDSVHPFFSILIFPIATLLRLIGLPAPVSVELTVGSCSLFAPWLMFLILRLLRLDRIGAGLGTLLLMTSATFFFWYSQTETYPFTSLSTLVTLWLVLRWRDEGGRIALLASLASFSMTITNWTLGIAAVGMKYRLGAFLRVCALTLIAAIVIAKAQAMIFPAATPFYHPSTLSSEAAYTQPEMAKEGEVTWTPVANWRGVLVTSAVAPMPYIERLPDGRHILDNQLIPPAHYGPIGIAAVLCWVGAIFLSVIGLGIDRKADRMIAAMAIFMLGQFVLHTVYGDITFLFAADFLPVLVILVALGGLTRLRRIHALAMIGCIVLGGFWNLQAYRSAIALAQVPLAAHQGAPASGA